MNGVAGVLPAWLIWLGAICTIVTPIALFIIGVASTSRKTLMQNIDAKVTSASIQLTTELGRLQKDMKEAHENLAKELKDSRGECREDINGILSQLSEYPRRMELTEAMREMRGFVRDLNQGRRNDPSS